MPKLKNLRLGVYDIPGHGKLRKGQVANVSSSLIANGRIASLISRGKLAIVEGDKEVLMPLPRRAKPADISEADTQPVEEAPPPAPEPAPAPEPEVKEEPAPAPEPEVKEEPKPIIKKRRRRKKTEDASES
tara:strand:+ start:814 stop:1206 length:393 start_codon:yes stop_codon:yes gene_type:complete